MRARSIAAIVLLLGGLTACGDDADQQPAGGGTGGDGGGGGDGATRPLAGVPEDACAPGFAPDGNMGCDAILPAQPCPRGTMAVPGETTCRPVAPCGSAPWGTIPVDATTQYVDQNYVGGSNNGSAQRPWITIGEAVSVASDGGLVAVAEGTNVEDVDIAGRSVRHWGRCPAIP